MQRTPTVWTAVLAWLLAAAGMLGGGMLIHPEGAELLAISLAQASVALPVLLLLIQMTPTSLGLGPVAWRRCLHGVAMGPLAVGVSLVAGGLLFALVGPPPANQPVERVIGVVHDQVGLTGLILLAAVLPGVVEEALFRGVILNGLRQRLSPAAAVLITALLFAALHMSPWRFVPQLALGCLLGWMTLRSGSCWPAAITHVVHNAILVTVAVVARGHPAVH